MSCYVSLILKYAFFATALCTTWLLANAIYNVFFHPLRHIPGPKLNAISRLPYVRHLLAGTTVQHILELHDLYGEVVRFSPNEVSFTSVETAWPDIYGFRTGRLKGHLNMQKDPVWYPKPVNGAPSILVADDENHARGRRVLAHAFSERALSEQLGILYNYVDQLIEGLRLTTSSGGTTNLVEWYNWTTFDIIADLLFGEPFGCLRDRMTHKYVSLLLQSLKGFRLSYVLAYFPWVRYMGNLIIDNKVMQGRVQFVQWVAEQVRRRYARESQREDFMTQILRHNDKTEGHSLSQDEVTSNSQLILSAGSETTATLLAGLTYLLLQNPQAMDKLKSEVRSTWQSSDQITLETAVKATYLNAVLSEGLRFFPPVPTGFERRTAKGGEVVSGYYIPEDTALCVSSYPAHHSERNFREAWSFIPERWLGDSRFASDKRSGCQPFSFGPRACLGKNLAWAEMRLILAKMIFNFDMQLDPKCRNWLAECKVMTVWLKPALVVHLTPVHPI